MADERQALRAALEPALPQLADDIIAAIRAEVGDYRRPLDGAFGANVRLGVELALGRFMAEFAGAPPRAPNRAVYVELGRGEFREGRSLDALLSAYRVGARLSWRRIVDVGRDAGVAPDVLYELGEAMFAYIDGLSAESTEGYAQARETAAGGRALERRRLVALLLSDPPAGEGVLRAAADSAAWPLPRTLVAVAVGDPEAVAGRFGPDALAAPEDAASTGAAAGAGPGAAAVDGPDNDAGRPGDGADPADAAARTAQPAARRPDAARRDGLILLGDPDGPGRRAQLRRALAGADAVLGPPVGPREAARSAARARAGRRLQRRGDVPGGLTEAGAHLPTLLLHADDRLAADLAATALAPLADLTPAAGEKLRATLRAWLDAQGRVDPTAAALGVHPQTVRYRLGQLRDALGDALDDPEARLALDLALRASARIGP